MDYGFCIRDDELVWHRVWAIIWEAKVAIQTKSPQSPFIKRGEIEEGRCREEVFDLELNGLKKFVLMRENKVKSQIAKVGD